VTLEFLILILEKIAVLQITLLVLKTQHKSKIVYQNPTLLVIFNRFGLNKSELCNLAFCHVQINTVKSWVWCSLLSYRRVQATLLWCCVNKLAKFVVS